MHNELEQLAPEMERGRYEAALRHERRHADLEIRGLNAELRRANAELRQRVQTLERSNAELEQFAWAAGHDLKEPLRIIASYTQLLIARHGDSSDPEAREFAGFIRDGVERMRTLIDALSSYSRAARQPIEIGRVSSADMAVAEAMQTLRVPTEEAGATIVTGNLPAVKIDPAPLLQIFQNLLSNALKYRAERHPPVIQISAVMKSGEARFAVSDNGIGIRSEHYARIFELFRRLQPAEYPGLGIGLAICKRLVERYGGRIWVDSRPGIGSTFYFTLPAAEPETPR